VAYQETKCNSGMIKNKESKKNPENTTRSNRTVKSTENNPINSPRKTYREKKQTINYSPLQKVVVNKSLIKKISNIVKGHHISIDVMNRWQIVNKVFNNKLLHMSFTDQGSQSNMSLMIDYIYTDNKIFSDRELTDLIYLVGSRFVDGSRENQVNPYKIKVQDGKGVMATFTDSAQEKKYKYAQKGAIYKQGWLVQFTLLSHNKFSKSHQFAMQTLAKNIKIIKI